MLASFNSLLSEFQRQDPELGWEFRNSTQIITLGAGRAELSSWDSGRLSYFSNAAQLQSFDALVAALNLPPHLYAAINKSSAPVHDPRFGPTTQVTTWGERVERIRVTKDEFELRYADGRGRYQLRLLSTPLTAAQQQQALEWLAQETVMRSLARGDAWNAQGLKQMGLMPSWESLQIFASTKAIVPLAMGAKFLCRVLTIYPEYLLIWRGLGGEEVLRGFVAKRLSAQKENFEHAVQNLPDVPADFWTAPPLPELPDILAAAPDAPVGTLLPPVNFWAKPEQNAAFAEGLRRAYKALPKKILKTIDDPWR